MGECGNMIPCSTVLKENQTILKFTAESPSIIVNLKEGLNKYILPEKLRIRKGSVLMLTFSGLGRIALTDEVNLMNYTDFILNLNSLKSFETNSRFLINSLVETGHYVDIKQINKIYPIYFGYNLKMKMSTSNTYLKVGVSINPTSSFISNLTYVANKTFTTSLNFDNGTCGFSFIDYLRNEIDPNCKISKKK